MITFEDCLHCTDLDEELATRLARRERLPVVVAVAKFAAIRAVGRPAVIHIRGAECPPAAPRSESAPPPRLLRRQG